MKQYTFQYFIGTFIILLSSLSTFSQGSYKAEQDGYFHDFTQTPYGLVFTDNYSSNLYRLKNKKLKIIQSTPNCGKYYTVSPNGRYVGFKYIDKNGSQAPAILDLQTLKTKILHTKEKLCGQPSIAGEFAVYTVNNTIFIEKNGQFYKDFIINDYINITPISPDAKNIAWCDNKGALNILNIATKKQNRYFLEGSHLVYPQWSPKTNKILLQAGKSIVVFSLSNNSFDVIAEGANPGWSKDARYVCYVKEEREFMKLKHSDIFIYDFIDKNNQELLQNNTTMQRSPSFIDENTLVYSALFEKTIVSIDLGKKKKEGKIPVVLYKPQDKIPFKHHNTSGFKKKSDILVPGEIPYIHQVYDTRDEHYGYGSCAPTTCLIAFAYYNILPPWPAQVDNGIGMHTSKYGNYISEDYRYNEYYYITGATTGGGDLAQGGYGYMWGNGSPSSTQKSYIENHNVSSDQLWIDDCTFNDTKNEIDQGYVHPICSYLTTSGHVTLAIGYVEGQYTLIFQDPYGDKNTPGYPSYDGQAVYYDWPGYNNGYQNLDATGAYGYVPWTTKARYNQATYNDLVIDDTYYEHGFYMNNTMNNAHMRYFRDMDDGYNDHFWYTVTIDSDDDVCWVSWTPTISETALYDVYAYVPSQYSTAQNAHYKVNHRYGTSHIYRDQSIKNNEWIPLGRYFGSFVDSCSVILGDNTGINSQEVAFDAVKWVKSGNWPLAAGFHVSSNKVFHGNSITFHNSSLGATSYEWYFEGGQPSASTLKHPIIAFTETGLYDVSLIASNSNQYDTLLLQDFIRVYSDENIETTEPGASITIWPNPCKDWCTISMIPSFTGKGHIYIYNLQGVLMRKIPVYFHKGKKFSYKLETDLSKGLYLLEIQQPGKSDKRKLYIY